jgi:hypothetical protein
VRCIRIISIIAVNPPHSSRGFTAGDSFEVGGAADAADAAAAAAAADAAAAAPSGRR